MIAQTTARAVLSLALLLSPACGREDGEQTWAAGRAKPFEEGKAPLPFELVGEIDTGEVPAPSGIVYHPLRKTLFVANDDGHVAELRTDGTLVQRRHLMFDDFEAITAHPKTGLLYIAIEGRDDVVEVDPDGLRIRREYDLPRTFEGRKIYERGGEGVEGMTFAPDAEHPEGGTFFVVNRSAHRKDLDDPPLLIEIELPLSSTSTDELKGRILRYKRLGITELSGLHYDAAGDRLYALSDKNNHLIELTRDGEILRVHKLEADSPEGITFDDDGFLYIAQDTGLILKFRPAPPSS